jgi:enoyl-CoA hydratase
MTWQQKYKLIRFSEENGVFVVTFDRGDGLNAVNAAMHTEMSWLFRDISDHVTQNAILLTGAGRAFSAGGDIDWFANMSREELDRLFVEARRIIVDLLEVPQPIVTAVNGPAVGLGATLALFGDVIYMSQNAVIADTHVLAGIAAGDGGAAIWPWIVGMPRAKEFLMTGARINAALAKEMGLVNYVVPDDQLIPQAMAMAGRLASGATTAIRATKAALNKILRDTVNLNLDTSLSMEKECFASEEHKALVAQFLAKRSR